MKRLLLSSMMLWCVLVLAAQVENPCGPLPNTNQLRWQDMEMYALIRSGASAMKTRSCSIPPTLTVDSGRVSVNKQA